MATSEDKPTKNGVTVEKEGTNLLGAPTFKELDNGRFKCVETGHELPSHAKDSYSQSKRCRIGLIDFSLTKSKPPLNMFKQDPLNSSKLICKLTGGTINKSEEHIWKHINGKHFFSKLEQMEAGELPCNGNVEEKGSNGKENDEGRKKKKDKKDKKKKKKKEKKEKKEKTKEDIVSEMRDSTVDSDTSDAEECEFWMPPKGERWDFDDGGDRWGSDSESGEQLDEDDVEDYGISKCNLNPNASSSIASPSASNQDIGKSKVNGMVDEIGGDSESLQKTLQSDSKMVVGAKRRGEKLKEDCHEIQKHAKVEDL